MTESTGLPKIDFTTFILSISSAAFMGLGIRPLEDGAEATHKINLELARQNIDLLELVHDKTKGNLSAEEDTLLTQMLFETRMRYVEVQKSGKK